MCKVNNATKILETILSLKLACQIHDHYVPWEYGDLFNGDRFCQIAWEINVESLSNSKPISNKLQRNNVEKSLKAVNGLWDLNLFGLGGRELWVVMVANHNGTTTASNHW